MKRVVGLVLMGTLLAFGALAGVAHAQDAYEAEVLQEESEIQLDPVDTFISQGDNPQSPDQASTVTMSGSQVYLLSPSSIGGAGIQTAIAERYQHGDLTNATLTLRYEQGCNGQSGTFSVRVIKTQHWDPRGVVWNETDLHDPANATVHVHGPLLGQLDAGLDEGNCSRADIPLDLDRMAPVLEGNKGGLAVFWEGTHAITLHTLNGNNPPRLNANITTNVAKATAIELGDGTPAFSAPGEALTLHATVDGSERVPEGSVEATFVNEIGVEIQRSILSREGGEAWRSDVNAPETQGIYNVTVNTTDEHGWTHTLASDAWDLIVDETPPRLDTTLLNGHEEGDVSVHQFDTILLQALIDDVSCTARLDPCASWSLTWGPPENPLGVWNGSIASTKDGNGAMEGEIKIPRPGNATAKLTIEDPQGIQNATSWGLEAADMQPPTARPLAGSWLAPNISATVQKEQPIPLKFEVIDDLPVQARLSLKGPTVEERTLPRLADSHQVKDEIAPPSKAGNYTATLVLDDGAHTRELDWGALTVTPALGPAIHLDPVDRRIGPNTPVTAHLFDLNLDLNATQINASVDGDPLQPHIELKKVEDGGRATVSITGLDHAETVTVTAQAQDKAGNANTNTVSFLMDREPPQLTQPQGKAWYKPGSLVFMDASDPGGGHVTITASTPHENREIIPPANVSLGSLVPDEEGLHEVLFHLEDDVGNKANVTRLIGVDRNPPTLNATLDADGLVVQANGTGSQVARLDVSIGINGASLRNVDTIEQRPGVHRVLGLDDLERGDLVHVVVEAIDEGGNEATVGSPDQPVTFEYPGQPPGLELERTSSALGGVGSVKWEAWDPEGIPTGVSVTLQVTNPDGAVEVHPDQSASGTHTIEPSEEGRYLVEAIAYAGNRSTNETVAFHLTPEGEGTSFVGPPERVSPGESVEVTLQVPNEPGNAYVRAIDGSNLQHQASSITWQDGELVALFESLPEGDYEISAVIVHGPGLVEEVEMGSVSIASTMTESLRDAANVFLVVLVLGGMVIAGYAWYRMMRGDSEPEDS